MKAILFAIVLGVVLPLRGLANPTITSVPFELVRNLIIIKAFVNDKEGLFILDTGVSDVILNSRLFMGKPTGDKFYGVNGNEIEKETQFIKFNLEGFEKKVVATVTSFSELEKVTGLILFGVVGNSLFKNCEVILDYVFKVVTIYELDKDGNRFFSNPIHQIPLDTLSFYVGRGVPFIEVTANGKSLTMSLDTGASANVIDSREIDRMITSFSQIRADSLASFGDERVSVKSLSVDKMTVGKLSCPPMKTLFVTLDHLNQSQWGIKVDGILGYEFLSNFRVAINFRKKEIYLWDRESVEQQWMIAKIMEETMIVKGIKIF